MGSMPTDCKPSMTPATPRASQSGDSPTPTALQVEDLRVYYDTPEGTVRAVDGLTFSVKPSERLALVGESGCGKTTLVTALMRGIKPPGRIASGRILLNGRDLLQLDEGEMRETRLSEIALVPQAAMNSLNPVMRVKAQIADGIVDHEGRMDKADLDRRIMELLEGVGLEPSVATMFPHELSGGMKQRVTMAIATSLGPKVVLADEPTSALDVVVQRQIMEKLGELQERLGAAVVLVGHDMGLVAQFAETIGVMYAGRLVEIGPVTEVFDDPLHPYTELLIQSLPTLGEKRGLKGIPGLPPPLIDLPPGCPFAPRCPSAEQVSSLETPGWIEARPGRWVSCHLYSHEVHA